MTTPAAPDARRILIVEDEALIAAELEDRLRRRGFVTLGPVDTASAAVATTLAERPDLVLMDVRLKGEHDGIWAAGQIRDQIGTPVIFLTANTDIATYHRAQTAMPYGYVVKPFNERDLVVAVDTALIRVRAEHRLREDSLTFATIASAVADAVIVTDAGDTIRFLNPAAEHLTGWPWTEATGRQRHTTIPFVEVAHAGPAPQALPHDYRYGSLITRDGRAVTVIERRVPVVNAAGERIGTVTSITDAEELARLRTELADIEALSDAVFTAAPVAMALLDDAGLIRRMNPAFRRLVRHQESAPPVPAVDLMAEGDRAGFAALLTEPASASPSAPVELHLTRDTRHPVTVSSSLVAVPNPSGASGKIRLWQCIPIDEQKRLIVLAMSRQSTRPPSVYPPLPSATVLVVEDDVALRHIIQRMLERAGLTVTSVADGPEALACLRERPRAFDVVLTDIIMPAMSGGVLARQIETEFPDLPVVFMSGYHDDHLVHDSVVSGRRQLIRKPFTNDELCAMLREVLPSPAAVAEPGAPRV